VVIDRPTRQSGSAAYDNNCRDTDTALYLFADGRCLRRNVVQAHDPDVIAFRHVHESRDDGWYKMRLRFAPLVSLEPRYPPHRRERHVEGLDLTSNSPSWSSEYDRERDRRDTRVNRAGSIGHGGDRVLAGTVQRRDVGTTWCN
jgi:hypothetical protein